MWSSPGRGLGGGGGMNNTLCGDCTMSAHPSPAFNASPTKWPLPLHAPTYREYFVSTFCNLCPICTWSVPNRDQRGHTHTDLYWYALWSPELWLQEASLNLSWGRTKEQSTVHNVFETRSQYLQTLGSIHLTYSRGLPGSKLVPEDFGR
jgi:hypothetical protein